MLRQWTAAVYAGRPCFDGDPGGRVVAASLQNRMDGNTVGIPADAYHAFSGDKALQQNQAERSQWKRSQIRPFFGEGLIVTTRRVVACGRGFCSGADS